MSLVMIKLVIYHPLVLVTDDKLYGIHLAGNANGQGSIYARVILGDGELVERIEEANDTGVVHSQSFELCDESIARFTPGSKRPKIIFLRSDNKIKCKIVTSEIPLLRFLILLILKRKLFI